MSRVFASVGLTEAKISDWCSVESFRRNSSYEQRYFLELKPSISWKEQLNSRVLGTVLECRAISCCVQQTGRLSLIDVSSASQPIMNVILLALITSIDDQLCRAAEMILGPLHSTTALSTNTSDHRDSTETKQAYQHSTLLREWLSILAPVRSCPFPMNLCVYGSIDSRSQPSPMVRLAPARVELSHTWRRGKAETRGYMLTYGYMIKKFFSWSASRVCRIETNLTIHCTGWICAPLRFDTESSHASARQINTCLRSQPPNTPGDSKAKSFLLNCSFYIHTSATLVSLQIFLWSVMLRQFAQRLAQTTYRAAAQRHPTLHSQTGCCTSEAVAHVSYVNSLSRVCKPHGCSRVSLVRGHTTTAASEAAVAVSIPVRVRTDRTLWNPICTDVERSIWQNRVLFLISYTWGAACM